jgi:beta-glucosidase
VSTPPQSPGPAASPALGVVLSTLESLGPAATSNWVGAPGTGSDLTTRYAEDLALLAQLGVRVVRLGLDWSRLQPAPDRIDDDWREWYQTFLLTAQRHGIDVWVALHEDTVPAWFDDEGSFADGRAAGLLWPRWVEAAAEIVGDLVAGWFPMVDPVGCAGRWAGDPRKHEESIINIATAWRDAWRILRGGPSVATSLAVRTMRAVDQTVSAQEAARLDDHLRWRIWMRGLRDGVLRLPNGRERVIPDLGASLDVLGVSTSLDIPEAAISDDVLRRWEERLGSLLRRVAEDGPERPMCLSGIEVHWHHADERLLFVESTVRALISTIGDGVPLHTVIVDPAFSARPSRNPDRAASMLDRDRNVTGETHAWLALDRSRRDSGGGPTTLLR